MFTFLKYTIAEHKDDSLKKYDDIIYLINRDNYKKVLCTFKDKKRALFL